MNDLKNTATQIRRDILRMVHGANSGHPGGSLGCADFFTALFFKIMKHNKNFSMDGKVRIFFYCLMGTFPRFTIAHLQGVDTSIKQS
jgi:transketolase